MSLLWALGTHCEALGTLSVTNMEAHQVPLKEPYVPRGQHGPRDVHSGPLALLSGLTTGLILMASEAGNYPNRSAELAPTAAQRDHHHPRSESSTQWPQTGELYSQEMEQQRLRDRGQLSGCQGGEGGGKQLPLG